MRRQYNTLLPFLFFTNSSYLFIQPDKKMLIFQEFFCFEVRIRRFRISPNCAFPEPGIWLLCFFFCHISHHQGYRHFCCFFSPVPRLLASPWQWFLTFVFFPDHQGIFFFFILFFLMLFWRAVTGITIEDDDYEDFMSIITLQKGVFISVFFFNLICF